MLGPKSSQQLISTPCTVFSGQLNTRYWYQQNILVYHYQLIRTGINSFYVYSAAYRFWELSDHDFFYSMNAPPVPQSTASKHGKAKIYLVYK